MKQSAISWTDFSGGDLNFVTGCTPVSEGCQNCYAKAIYKRFGRDFSDVNFWGRKLGALRHKRFPEWSPKRGEGHRPMAFVCDTGDLFHGEIPDHWIARAVWAMASIKNVTWQVLTKRPMRMLRLWTNKDFIRTVEQLAWVMDEPISGEWPPPNIWLGVTAENQARADERIPLLLDTPAAVRFVSVEPMLGPVDLWWTEACRRCSPSHYEPAVTYLDWVICGAESGPKRRPFDVAWAVDLYEQCKDACVPFFGKQDSGLRPGVPLLIDGDTVHQWPL